MAARVRGVVKGAVATKVAWQRTVSILAVSRTGIVVPQQSTWQLTIRDVIGAARKVWLKCSLIDAVLVEPWQ